MLLSTRISKSIVQNALRRFSTSCNILKPKQVKTSNVSSIRHGSGGDHYGIWYRVLVPESEFKNHLRASQFLLCFAVAAFTYHLYQHPYDVFVWMDNHVTIDPEKFTDAELGVPPDDWADETDPVNFGLIKDHPYQKLRTE